MSVSSSSVRKKISATAIEALKQALTHVYWYKKDLRGFLTRSLSSPNVLARLNWDDYKRNIVASLVDYLSTHEHTYQQDLIQLMSNVCDVSDFTHLEKLDDGEVKARDARNAVNALRSQLRSHQEILDEKRRIEERREQSQQLVTRVSAVQSQLEVLKSTFYTLFDTDHPQRRGYTLEKILKGLFELFDLDPKASFRVIGEQIDGAFSFDGTDYLLEAKWQKQPVAAGDLDQFAMKVKRKLDNTLGLLLSVNGYSEDGVSAHSSGRRLVILMDGADLMAVLENRIDFVELLRRKRRTASETGNIYLRIGDILT